MELKTSSLTERADFYSLVERLKPYMTTPVL